MPRPKRSKVAPSAPTIIHHRRVPSPPIAASAVQRQKDLFSPASSERVTTASDDSDGLVVAKRTGAKRMNATPQEYTMSGALALEDMGVTRLRPPSSKTRAELTRITREADHKRAAEAIRAKKAKVSLSQRGELEEIPSSIPSESLLIGKHASNSGSPPVSARKSIQARLGSRTQETPRMQASSIAETGFKRRPRQPSLLQMVQSHNQTEHDMDDDDLYNFFPDDESTPLKLSSQPHAHAKSSSSDQTSSSRKRKQATPEIQVPASQSQTTLPHSSPSSTPQPPEQEDIFGTPTDDADDQPRLPRHRSAQTPEPQVFSDTLAPPQSSSPAKPDPKVSSSRRAKGLQKSNSKAQQPRRRGSSPAPSPLSSQSTQASPVRQKPVKPLTTATLQNLLPRRRVRRKPKGDYDLPSSSDIELDNTGLGEDEDELSFHTTKIRQKKSNMKASKSAAKIKETEPTKGAKTYARKSIVVSDNDTDDREEHGEADEADESAIAGKRKMPVLNGKAKAEMKHLAAKFREVDEYTLDFEDMTGGSSQMNDAR